MKIKTIAGFALTAGILMGSGIAHAQTVQPAAATPIYPPPTVFVMPASIAGEPAHRVPVDLFSIEDRYKVHLKVMYEYQFPDDVSWDSYRVSVYTSHTAAMQVFKGNISYGINPLHGSDADVAYYISGDGEKDIAGVYSNVLFEVYTRDSVLRAHATNLFNVLIQRVFNRAGGTSTSPASLKPIAPPNANQRNAAARTLFTRLNGLVDPCVIHSFQLNQEYQSYLKGNGDSAQLSQDAAVVQGDCYGAIEGLSALAPFPSALQTYATPIYQIIASWRQAMAAYNVVATSIKSDVDQGSSVLKPVIVGVTAQAEKDARTSYSMETGLLRSWGVKL